MTDSTSLSASDLHAALAALRDAAVRLEAPELSADEGLALLLFLEKHHLEERPCGS